MLLCRLCAAHIQFPEVAASDIPYRLEQLERRVDDHLGDARDYSEVRERGRRNEREIGELRGEVRALRVDMQSEFTTVRTELNDLRRAILTAALSLAVSAILIAATIFTVFH